MRKSIKIALLACVLGVAAVSTAGCGEKSTGAKPQVTIEMDDGQKIVIELLPEYAPNTVANFVSLANQGFYDGLVFHRIIPGFMIQGGDPNGDGTGDPGYSIKGEVINNGFKQNKLLHERGVVSMARGGAYDSAGCQFFIMVDTATHLDKDYAAFGKVVSGMEIVDDIVSGPRTGPGNDLAAQPRTMATVTVDTFGVEWSAPETIAR